MVIVETWKGCYYVEEESSRIHAKLFLCMGELSVIDCHEEEKDCLLVLVKCMTAKVWQSKVLEVVREVHL